MPRPGYTPEKKWTHEEVNYVKSNYGKKPIEEIASSLGRTVQSVRGAITRYEIVNPKLWTHEQDEFLKNNYRTMRYAEIGKILGRTEQAVSLRATEINLPRAKNCWSKEEIKYLKDNINKLSYEEISNHLGRSIGAIYNKVSELGIEHAKGYKILKLNQQAFIMNNYDEYTDVQFAKMFGCSEKAVIAVRKKFGIAKQRTTSNSTSIEDIVKSILNETGIGYQYHAKMDKYEVDFLIGESLVIEVMSDYFHCNPYIYGDGPKNEDQISYIVNDYYKKCYLLSRGYKLLYLWEQDINSNLGYIKEEILNFCRLNSKPKES